MKRVLILALLGGSVAVAECTGETMVKAVPLTPAMPVFVCSNAVYSLHEAAEAGDVGVIKARLAENTPVNELDELGRTPLLVAVESDKPEAVKALLAGGGDVLLADREGRVPKALTKNKAVIQLLTEAEAVRMKELELSRHIEVGDTEAVKVALEAGLDPNAQAAAPEQGILISQALMLGREDIALMLLEKGAKVRYTAPNGKSLLHLAAASGCAAVVSALLEKGADPMAHGPNGATALHDAVWMNRADTVKALLPAYKECRFNPDGGGQSAAPAMAAGRGDALRMVFAEAGLDPNMPLTKNGESFLMLCVRNNAGAAVIKALMEKGGNPDLRDAEGKSVKDYANDMIKPLLTK